MTRRLYFPTNSENNCFLKDNGHKLGQRLGDGEGQRGVPWGCKELDMTGQLNNIIKTLTVTNEVSCHPLLSIS